MSPTEEDLEITVGRLLREQGLTLATAESCTGGLVSHRITNVPGSSDYYRGSITAYADDVKATLLGVRRETLAEHGAVSEQAAREMARGVREALGTDVAVSVTGIAGPGGGTAEKPVGLVYIALTATDGEWAERHVWAGDRRDSKARSADAALDLLRRYLEGLLMRREPIAVEAHFDVEGEITPHRFEWQGSLLAVEGVGRRWTEGAERCFNVMAMGGRLFQLRLNRETLRWSIARGPLPRMAV
ncbi:MAG: CinA family protein [Anaerolineae bacterium]|jgi:nicotinamide-nucleotide amidase